MKRKKNFDAFEFAAKAHCGELVSPEAKLARRQGRSYEPASAPLAQNECVTGKRRITEADLAAGWR
jgi:hypothetical protein